MLVLLMGQIYELRPLDRLRCLIVRTKFHEDSYGHSSNFLSNLKGYNVGITDGREL
jgi:hypothetical protein